MKINHDIPEPENSRRTWPFKDMQVGDSFFCAETENGFKCLRSAASYHKKLHPPFDYISKKVIENGIKGVRTWRTKDLSPATLSGNSAGIQKTKNRETEQQKNTKT